MFQPFQQLYQQLNSSNPRLYQAFDKVSMYLQDLYSNQNQVTDIASDNIIVQEVISSSGLTVTPKSPAVPGSLLIVFIKQGFVVAWSNTAFKIVTGSTVPTTAGLTSILLFAGRSDGFWYLTATILGRKV